MIRQVLFHWSPLHRRHGIRRQGLKINSPNTISTERVPYISLSPDPKTAWELSASTRKKDIAPVWDLWMVDIPSSTPIEIVPYYGTIQEVRALDSIPSIYIWHCGLRRLDA